MSVSAKIDIKLASHQSRKVSPTIIIDILFNSGWRFEDHGEVCYLPYGDNNNFEWKRDNITQGDLLLILKEKERLGELIGVVITWQYTRVGGNLLFFDDGTISMALNINRRLVYTNQLGITDINWYLTKLLQPLCVEGVKYESYSYVEHL